ncbi:unnamed protein product, partial [Mycena citricolor]
LSSGSNAHGQLSNGSLDDAHSFVACGFTGTNGLPASASVLDLAFGANHTLALLRFGDDAEAHTELWGCGDGRAGQLGTVVEDASITSFRPLAIESSGRRPRLIAACWETSYVVMSSSGQSDVLISMGANDFGDLGIGVKNGPGQRPSRDPHVVPFGCVPSEMQHVDWISTGPHHVVVKLRTADDASVLVGWGASRHGQLGPHAESPFATSPSIIPSPAISQAALGNQHTLLVDDLGRVSGLGSNRKQQLEIGAGCHGVDPVAHCTWNGSYVEAGEPGNRTVLSVGSNLHGQLGRPPDGPLGAVRFPFERDGRRLLQVAAGSEHVLALFRGECTEVWGWGWNEHGNLGIGTTQDAHIPTLVWAGPASTDVRVWAGLGTSWILVR